MTELKRMRKALNINQYEFGRHIGVDQKRISRFERGEMTIPRDVRLRISRCEYFKQNLPADESWDYMDWQAAERWSDDLEIEF